MKKSLLLLLLLTSLFSFSVTAQEETYEETLGKMLKASGSDASYEAAINQMIGMFKQQQKGLGDEFWNDLKTEMQATSMDELTKLLVPVYQKVLTQEDLNGIIAFYQTPVGQKYAANMGAITQGSMEAGQQWGMQLGQKLAQKIQDAKE